MSRFIRTPVPVPDGVEVSIDGGKVVVKGPRGEVRRDFATGAVSIRRGDAGVEVSIDKADDHFAIALAGTYWRLLDGMVKGVKEGVERILDLVGVGYRAQVSGDKLVLQLGYSHPIHYTLPAGVTATMNTQTEIVLKGVDKETVGQVAAEIRSYRPPEPYKGKGVRYRNEKVTIKETKKK